MATRDKDSISVVSIYNHMNWTNYQYIYDLYINGKKVQRIWGHKKALKIAEQQSGCLFDVNHVELYNIITGELIYERG